MSSYHSYIDPIKRRGNILIILFLICVLFGIGCQQNESKIKIKVIKKNDGKFYLTRTKEGLTEGRNLILYPNKGIAAIFYFKNDQQQGLQYWFYPDKKVERIRGMKDGKVTGRGYIFFPSGRIGFIDSIFNEQRIGNYWEFYDTPSSPVHIHAFYDSSSSEEPTYDIEYDLHGKIISCKKKGEKRIKF